MTAPELYRVPAMPVLQNRVFESAIEATNCVTGDIVLVQDSVTGLVFNQAYQADLVCYDQNYQNEQGLSTTFLDHLLNVAAIIGNHFDPQDDLVEIGCGKGFFLDLLRKRGVSIRGIDPAYEGNSPYILQAPFSPQAMRHAKGVILRHVLEHVPDPLGFLRSIRDANGGQGTIYIEVPCFDWICKHRAWFDISYEHVNYFREVDFRAIFGSIQQLGRSFGDQYLYVVADLSTLRVPSMSAIQNVSMPPDFISSIHRFAGLVNSGRKERGPPAVVWGGSSKGVVFSILMSRAGANIDYVIDINPAKQGGFLPVSGLRVLSPIEATPLLPDGTRVFVMNSNYLSEIRKATNYRFNYISIDHE